MTNKKLFQIHGCLELNSNILKQQSKPEYYASNGPNYTNNLLDAIVIGERLRKQTSESVLNATNLNYVKPSGRFEYPNQVTLKRLHPWMVKAKKRETSDKTMHELSK